MKGVIFSLVVLVAAIGCDIGPRPGFQEMQSLKADNAALRSQVLKLGDSLEAVKAAMPAACQCTPDCCCHDSKPTAAYCTPKGCFSADGALVKKAQCQVKTAQKYAPIQRKRFRGCRSCGR